MLWLLDLYVAVSLDLLDLVSNDIAVLIKSHKKLNVERQLQCNSHVSLKPSLMDLLCVGTILHIT